MLDRWNTGGYQREIIRPNICGNFTDLVKKVTLSWTMIHHLDNEKSVGPIRGKVAGAVRRAERQQ